MTTDQGSTETAALPPRPGTGPRQSVEAIAIKASQDALAGEFDAAFAKLDELEASDKAAVKSLGKRMREIIEYVRPDPTEAAEVEQFDEDEDASSALTVPKQALGEGEGKPLFVFIAGTGKFLPQDLAKVYLLKKDIYALFSHKYDIENSPSQSEFFTRLGWISESINEHVAQNKPSKVIVVGGSRYGFLAGMVTSNIQADHCVMVSPITSITDASLRTSRNVKGRQLADRMQQILPHKFGNMMRIANSWKPGCELDVIYAQGADQDVRRARVLESVNNVRFHAFDDWTWHDSYPLLFTSGLIDQINDAAMPASTPEA